MATRHNSLIKQFLYVQSTKNEFTSFSKSNLQFREKRAKWLSDDQNQVHSNHFFHLQNCKKKVETPFIPNANEQKIQLTRLNPVPLSCPIINEFVISIVTSCIIEWSYTRFTIVGHSGTKLLIMEEVRKRQQRESFLRGKPTEVKDGNRKLRHGYFIPPSLLLLSRTRWNEKKKRKRWCPSCSLLENCRHIYRGALIAFLLAGMSDETFLSFLFWPVHEAKVIECVHCAAV